MRKSNQWRAQRQQARTKRHESKRRDVRNAYRPRTTGQGKRARSRYITPAEALAMYLMPNYEIARANQFLQALRRVQQRKAA